MGGSEKIEQTYWEHLARYWTKDICRGNQNERWSCLNFPNEKPDNSDFKFSTTALRRIVLGDSILDRLEHLSHEDCQN